MAPPERSPGGRRRGARSCTREGRGCGRGRRGGRHGGAVGVGSRRRRAWAGSGKRGGEGGEEGNLIVETTSTFFPCHSADHIVSVHIRLGLGGNMNTYFAT